MSPKPATASDNCGRSICSRRTSAAASTPSAGSTPRAAGCSFSPTTATSTQKLTHPSYGVPKTYKIVCDGEVTPDAIERLKKGVYLADRETKTATRTAPRALQDRPPRPGQGACWR